MSDLALSVYGELWVSLASLLRSYTAVHGLNNDRQATVELGEERITVRHGENWLDLKRNGSLVAWRREDGQGGELELTEAGRLRSCKPSGGEEELDMAAEAWARELMQ
ncbi:MAG: transcriptional regulator [Terracidiphilus sp.]